ncbi:MAG: hypothetical protein IJ086_14195 [Clostridium sp.]|nr:hypothetical protein [Clostridium sp.]
MLKVRATFVDNERGNKELEDFLELLRENKMFMVVSESKVYKGRGNSQYSNIYVDIEYK